MTSSPTPAVLPDARAQNHKSFPHIANLTVNMVHHNCGYAARIAQGMTDPVADMMRLLDETLGAEGVYYDDLAALDNWLGALSKKDFNTVADGDDVEVGNLLKSAPDIGDVTARDWIDGVYEHCI